MIFAKKALWPPTVCKVRLPNFTLNEAVADVKDDTRYKLALESIDNLCEFSVFMLGWPEPVPTVTVTGAIQIHVPLLSNLATNDKPLYLDSSPVPD